MARSAGVLQEGTLLEDTLLEGTLLEGTLLEDTLLEGTKNRPKTTKSGGPKSAVFHGGSRVAEMPGRAGSGRAGTIRIFEHTLNNARFAPSIHMPPSVLQEGILVLARAERERVVESVCENANRPGPARPDPARPDPARPAISATRLPPWKTADLGPSVLASLGPPRGSPGPSPGPPEGFPGASVGPSHGP